MLIIINCLNSKNKKFCIRVQNFKYYYFHFINFKKKNRKIINSKLRSLKYEDKINFKFIIHPFHYTLLHRLHLRIHVYVLILQHIHK